MATISKDWCVSVAGKVVYSGSLSKADIIFDSVTNALSVVGCPEVPVVLYRSAGVVSDS